MWFRRKRRAKLRLELPKADLRAMGRLASRVSLPEIKLPELKVAEKVRLPDVTLPRIAMGEVRRQDFQLPDVTLPRVALGEFKRQDVPLPDITLPRLKPGELSFKDIELKPLGRGPRKLRRIVRLAVLGLFGLAVWQEFSQPESERQWHGTVLGVPYDFRPPTSARLRQAWWNQNAGLFTPSPWGLGWTVNFFWLREVALQNAQLRRTAERLSMIQPKEPVAPAPGE